MATALVVFGALDCLTYGSIDKTMLLEGIVVSGT